MLYTFIQSKQFSKTWDDLGLLDEDLRLLEVDIMKAPKKAPIIPKTGKLRKMRWEYNGKGKRGGARICYIHFEAQQTIYLMLLYAKNEKEDLTEDEKKQIKAMIDELEKEV